MPKTYATSPGMGGLGDYTYLVEADPTDPTLATVYNNRGIQVQAPAESGVNINWGLANLTAGRTWKEKVVCLGYFTPAIAVGAYDYTDLEVIGRIIIINGVNVNVIENVDPAGGNQYIEIHGGWVDANRANNTDNITIYMSNVDNVSVHDMIVHGGDRTTVAPYGEGIQFEHCNNGQIYDNLCYDAGYDDIKISGTGSHHVVSGNIVLDSVSSGGIQSSSTGYSITISNNVVRMTAQNQNGVKMHNSDFSSITDNTIYDCDLGIELVGYAHDNLISNNNIYDCNYGVVISDGSLDCHRNIIVNNQMSEIDAYGVQIRQGDDNYINQNYFYNMARGISIDDVDCERTRVGPDNHFIGVTTCLVDGGLNTILPAITVPFVDGTDPQDSGFLINAAAEMARAYFWLPLHVQQVMKIKVYARAGALSGTTMAAEFVIEGGADNEVYTTHTGSVANHPSTSSVFAADDVIFWTVATAGVLALLGGDSGELKVLHEAANAGGVETNAYFRTVSIEYV